MIDPKDVHRIISQRIPSQVFDLTLDLRKSKGVRIYDSRYDREFLDFFGFFATSPLGMNHPKMFDQDFLYELETTAINKPTNSDIYTPELAEFVATLSRVATPSYMRYFFFIDGGALAVENALKTAFDWKIRKNIEAGHKKELGTKVIHFKEAFHGRSGYTLSLTNTFDPNKIKYFPKFKWPRVTNPKITFPLEGKNLIAVEAMEQKSIREIKSALKTYKDDVAALIIEPIQAEGGDNHFRGEYLNEIQRICNNNDIMFIMDEVQTGLGTTGKWWAHQHFGLKPDIIVFGKKMQVCGIMVGPRVDEIKDNVFHVPSRINSTWGGNLTDMVRAARYLTIMEEEKLVENAAVIGEYFLARLRELQERHAGKISNVRGRGLMVAFDLPDTKMRDTVNDALYKNGLLSLKTGERGIRFRPPLIITKTDVDEAVSRIEKSL